MADVASRFGTLVHSKFGAADAGAGVRAFGVGTGAGVEHMSAGPSVGAHKPRLGPAPGLGAPAPLAHIAYAQPATPYFAQQAPMHPYIAHETTYVKAEPDRVDPPVYPHPPAAAAAMPAPQAPLSPLAFTTPLPTPALTHSPSVGSAPTTHSAPSMAQSLASPSSMPSAPPVPHAHMAPQGYAPYAWAATPDRPAPGSDASSEMLLTPSPAHAPLFSYAPAERPVQVHVRVQVQAPPFAPHGAVPAVPEYAAPAGSAAAGAAQGYHAASTGDYDAAAPYYAAEGDYGSMNTTLSHWDNGGDAGLNGAGGDGHGGLGEATSQALVMDGQSEEDRPKKPKKLQLACHFCRGRKLKCDGTKPQCWHCAKRLQECIYDDHVRRRGPGKRTKEMRARAAIEAAADGLVDPSDPTGLLGVDVDVGVGGGVGVGVGASAEAGPGPSTLAESSAKRNRKRKSDAAGGADDKKPKVDPLSGLEQHDHAALHDVAGVGVGVGVEHDFAGLEELDPRLHHDALAFDDDSMLATLPQGDLTLDAVGGALGHDALQHADAAGLEHVDEGTLGHVIEQLRQQQE
ncbi:hypothetical protein Q5752_001852 [Cryptotrichosporon argae]